MTPLKLLQKPEWKRCFRGSKPYISLVG